MSRFTNSRYNILFESGIMEYSRNLNKWLMDRTSSLAGHGQEKEDDALVSI